jgi:phosphoglycolate phosphatase
MQKRRIRNIIWDWNGTLLNDMVTCIECMNIMLNKRSLPQISSDHYREVFTFPVREYFLQIGFDFSREDFKIPAVEFVDLYNSKYEDACLFPEAKGTLRHFSNQGFNQFILSAQENSLLRRLIMFYGLEEYFSAVTGIADNFAESKVEAGKQMMENLRLAPGETVMIGDTVHDYEVSEALGISCLLISHGHQSAARLSMTGAPVIDSYFEIEEYLNRRMNWIQER